MIVSVRMFIKKATASTMTDNVTTERKKRCRMLLMQNSKLRLKESFSWSRTSFFIGRKFPLFFRLRRHHCDDAAFAEHLDELQYRHTRFLKAEFVMLHDLLDDIFDAPPAVRSEER